MPNVDENKYLIKDGVFYDKKIKIENQHIHIMEKIFQYPILYNMKMQLCSLLNPHPNFNISNYLLNKKVLNVGCGPRNYYIDEKLPSELVGFDMSPQFISTIQKNSNRGFYYVGSIQEIPFPDEYFNTTLMVSVLHHLSFEHSEIIKELARVTKEILIIYDHKLSSRTIERLIQSIYWEISDGGTKYNTEEEWDKLLKPFRVIEKRFTGRLFNNISQFILAKK